MLAIAALASTLGAQESLAEPSSTPRSAAKAAPAAAPTEARQPALFAAQAQFVEQKATDGRALPVPGPAKLTIVRMTPQGASTTILEDPESNVFHKAVPWNDGILTIAATKARLKTWRLVNGQWVQETHWAPTFGGKFDRLRDVERADLDGDGKDDLAVATHDQGVIAIVHPAQGWRVEEIDREPSIFVHEIEIGDVDGDGRAEIFATPSHPNKLDREQPGEVRMYRLTKDEKGAMRWIRSVVDAPGDTHAKEILVADVDRDRTPELYVVWEGAIGKDGALARPVTIKQYRWRDGRWTSEVVASIPDRQMRAIAAGDVNGDGRTDLVAAGLGSGVWLIERDAAGKWSATVIDAQSSGFEHPVALADLDGDGALEIYVGAENQKEIRRYRFRGGRFEKDVVAPLAKGDITWNLTAGTH